jgi:hypothetical protein
LQSRLQQELQTVLRTLDDLGDEPGLPALTVWDAGRMQEQLLVMASQVRSNDGEAVHLAMLLLSHARGTALEPVLRAVSEALDQFDFDEAQGLLSQGLPTQQAPLSN